MDKTTVLHIRIPVDLLKRLEKQAQRETRTTANLIVAILVDALPEREKAAKR